MHVLLFEANQVKSESRIDQENQHFDTEYDMIIMHS